MVRVWNVTTGQQLERLKGHKDSVYRYVTSSPTSFPSYPSITFRRTQFPLVSLRRLFIPLSYIFRLTSTTLNSLLQSSFVSLRLTSFDDALPLLVSLRSTTTDNSVAFSPDGKSLVSGSLDRTLRVWDLSATKRAVESSMPGSKEGVEKGLGTCQSTLNGHKVCRSH
jgi:WD40 repeat protein